MIRVIGDKLLHDEVADYIHMRAVCSSWRSSNDKPTWETKYYPRNWVMLLDDEDDDEEDREVVDVVAEASPPAPMPQPQEDEDKDEEDIEVDAVAEAVAALVLQQAGENEEEEEQQVTRRFVNVRTGAMLRAQLPSFKEYGHLRINAEGLHLIYNEQTDRMRLINPLTGTMAVFPGLSHLEKYVSLDFAAAGVIFDKNAPERPTVVLVVVLLLPHRYAVMLCAKPGDEHWGTVDTSAMEADEDGHTRPSLQGCLSLQGQFYVPMPDGNVLRVELLPHPRLVYAARLNLRTIAVTYLVPSLLDSDAAEGDDDVIMVRVFGVEDDIESFGIHFGRGTYKNLDDIGNRTIFVPGLTIRTDRFASIAEVAPPGGSVRIDDYIENYIV
ncbi:hypothetical protein BS78_08G079200 [Paspalum vaginatum]|nr:hypothetical protein BS78_08G079200 [Paspalum vaginatum]